MARGRFPTVRLGLKSLLLHKLRSFLTVLGLLFGVSSVIAMLAVGEGASYEALQQLKTLGPTNLMARSQKPPITEQSSQGSGRTAFAYGLKYIDLDRIRATFPHAEHIVAVKETQENLRRGIAWTSAYIVGTEPEYMEVMNLEIAEGRWLSHLDLSHRENCIVLGAGAVARLFPREPSRQELPGWQYALHRHRRSQSPGSRGKSWWCSSGRVRVCSVDDFSLALRRRDSRAPHRCL
jgi:putative ABC transport system permease protein